ncbi:hypothetical protein WPG_0359 [Winogradskyella sp. PG-2]|nr:hypothetical protein WPG_0359 [Winogradskyella sp. PG-2]
MISRAKILLIMTLGFISLTKIIYTNENCSNTMPNNSSLCIWL